MGERKRESRGKREICSDDDSVVAIFFVLFNVENCVVSTTGGESYSEEL